MAANCRGIFRLVLVAFLACFGMSCYAYPDRPVRLVVAYAAGGNADVIARAVAQRLTERWGQQIIVDNRPGASGIIGTSIVAKAPADGHTLLVTGTSHTTNPSLYKSLPYNTQADLAPVTLFATTPLLLLVNANVPATTVKELIALARSTQGGLTYASTGAGGGPHLATELFRLSTNVPLLHVPFKGATPALTDLLAGNVQLMFGSLLTALPHARGGKLRALAVTSARRAPAAMDIPTLQESGVPGYEANSWYGLFAPAGTNRAIVAKIATDSGQVLRNHMRKQLETEGAMVVANEPSQFSEWINKEIRKWETVIQKSGITVN